MERSNLDHSQRDRSKKFFPLKAILNTLFTPIHLPMGTLNAKRTNAYFLGPESIGIVGICVLIISPYKTI